MRTGIADLSITLSLNGPHEVRYVHEGTTYAVEAGWVVDTTGRSKFLTRQLGLQKKNPIRHGSSFFWVEGLLNVEKLTGLTLSQSRLHKRHCLTGHLPTWLATNHFVGEGFWFWIIPLHGKTSLGLVYDRQKISADLVSTPEKLIEWVCSEFPLFGRDLRNRKVLDHSIFNDFSYDCQQTISDAHWALSGEAGRFTDPLYSPGGDLIALHNTLIADCILTRDARQLQAKTRVYEVMMQAFYEAYVPSYAVSYEALGDQECFAMKYAWELTVYFTFFVFPFINDLFTDLKFAGPFLREFAKLGALNHSLQQFITSYYRWKKNNRIPPTQPQYFDFTELKPLEMSAGLFYKVGLPPAKAIEILKKELCNLQEFGRFIVAHVYSVVSGDRNLITNQRFIEDINLSKIEFNPDRIRKCADRQEAGPSYQWGFNPNCLTRLQSIAKEENNRTPAEPLDEPMDAAYASGDGLNAA